MSVARYTETMIMDNADSRRELVVAAEGFAHEGKWTKGLRGHKRKLTELALDSLSSWSSTGNYGNEDFIQVIDFFSGCGGMSLGFAALSQVVPSFRIVGGCDIDPDASASFQRNFGVPGAVMDILELASNEGSRDDFLHQLEDYKPKRPLVVIGCAPCQGFTSHRKKNWDKRDARNTLVGAFSSLAVQLEPDCLVMENVPEMLGRKYWDHFTEAREVLEEAGYVVHQTIYNSAAFGTPQERFRAVVIAMKRDFLLPEPLLGPERFRTVRDAIGYLPPIDPGKYHPEDNLHRSAGHRKSTLETIRAVPKDGGSRPNGVGPQCLDKINGFSDVYGRLYWDRPAITITHYARNPASGRFVHPEQDRGLTMREAALLQGFPPGFEFVGSFDSVFKQIGEAVPPNLAVGIAADVLVELLSPPPTGDEKREAIQSIHEPVSSSYSSVIAGLKQSRRKI